MTVNPTVSVFNSRHTNGPPYAYGTGEVTAGNGLYRYGASAFPNQSYEAGNYRVDVIFTQTAPLPSTPHPVSP